MRVYKQVLSRLLALSLVFLFLLNTIAAAEEHLLPLQGTAKINNAVLTSGSIIIEIYDAASGGNLVYNSTNDFLNTISGGKYDILLGNGSQPLSLRFGTKYYMDVYLNGTDMDFNGSERQVFMSTVGNITVTTPLRTTNNDTDDALNVSGGTFLNGTTTVQHFFNITPTTSAVRTNGTVTILNTDADDTLNVSNGGGNFRGQLGVQNYTSATIPAFTVNYGFNVSGANSNLVTNGSIKILNPSVSNPAFSVNNAFNITAPGGLETNETIITRSTRSVPAFSVNDGFNISGADESLRTNGTVTILNNDTDDALNISNGGSFFGGNVSINGTVNITAANGDIRTAGRITSLSTDADDALNVSNGGGNFRGQLGVQNYTSATIPAFTVNYGFNVSGANNALSTNGTVTMGSTAVIQSTDADDALNVSNGGGNFRGQLGVQNYTSATIPALTVNYGFNISGADESLRTNGTVTILNNDTDDALNISNGGSFFGGNVSINGTVNITAANGDIRTAGRITSLSTDTDDSINTTGGIFIGRGTLGAQLGIGGLTISDLGVITTDTTIGPTGGRGNIVIRSLAAQALSINAGFNVSGPTLEMRTNGTVTILSNDTDDALNISIGSAFIGGNLTIGDRTEGIFVNEQGSILVGNGSSTRQPHVDIFDGGTDKCGYLVLYDETGVPFYIFVASTGELMIKQGQPSTCANNDGAKVGTQT